MSGATASGIVAGIDIGGTTTSVLLSDAAGSVLAERVRSTPAIEGGRAMMNTAVDLVRELSSELGVSIDAVGVGAAGVVDTAQRRIIAASGSFTDWADYRVGAHLDAALGVPNTLVNDVNAFLAGEVAEGAARGLRDVAGLTLGTGVGGALFLGGALYLGPTGAAGELGHSPGYEIAGYGVEPCTCGGFGHLESIASGRSIMRRYRARAGESAAGLGGAAIAERARREVPDEAAIAVYREAGQMVGQAAITLAATLDVTHVVVGGGVTGAWAELDRGISEYLRANPAVSGREVRVFLAELGSRAVAIGAATEARSLLA